MPLTGNGSAGFRAWPPETGCRGGLLLLTFTLAGCCAAGGCAAAGAPAVPGVTRAPVPRLVLPFDAYKTTPEQRATLGNAHNLLVVRCMREHGIAIDPPAEDPALIAAVDPGNSRRYGVVDTGAATTHGYHLARPPSPDTTATWAAKLPESARRHLYGPRGCLGRASQALERGAPRADWPWLSRQDALTLERSAREPSVTQAVRSWQQCMSRAGHSYRAPEAAIADRRWNLEKPAVTAAERQTALADTRCKWSSGLVDAWHVADVRLQRAVIHGNAGRFDALRANLRHRLHRASAVLAEDEGGQVG